MDLIRSERCPVLDARVRCVTDFEGRITSVICPQFDEVTASCRTRRHMIDGGRLSELVERVAGYTLDTRTARCVLMASS